MAAPSAPSIIEVNDGYWQEVSRVLRDVHRLTRDQAHRGIVNYRAALERDDIGELIYHSPIEDTVRGILVGGYLAESAQEPNIAKVAPPIERPARERRPRSASLPVLLFLASAATLAVTIFGSGSSRDTEWITIAGAGLAFGLFVAAVGFWERSRYVLEHRGVPSPSRRFTVVVDGVEDKKLQQMWSELCQSSVPSEDFKALYPFVTTVSGNRFRFRGGDPSMLRRLLENLFAKSGSGESVKVHEEV